jgi:hypothetical protein
VGAATVPVAIGQDASGGGLAARIGPAGAPVTALVAFYEPRHLTPVGRGENGGRQLLEFRIVRQAATLARWDGAPRTLALPPLPAGMGAAVLVQAADLSVRGAADRPPVGA